MEWDTGNLRNLDISNIESMTQEEQMELVNTMLKQETGLDMETGMQALTTVDIVINIITLIFFVTFSIGLYKLSKKFGDKHSWLAFVPIVQFYTLIKTAGLPFWKGFWWVVWRGILAAILVMIILAAMGFVGYMLFQNSSNYGLMFTLWIIGYICVVLLASYITYYFLFKAMADRAGQSKKTAVLMTLFPFVMLWVVANRLGNNFAAIENSTSSGISQDTVSTNEL